MGGHPSQIATLVPQRRRPLSFGGCPIHLWQLPSAQAIAVRKRARCDRRPLCRQLNDHNFGSLLNLAVTADQAQPMQNILGTSPKRIADTVGDLLSVDRATYSRAVLKIVRAVTSGGAKAKWRGTQATHFARSRSQPVGRTVFDRQRGTPTRKCATRLLKFLPIR